MSNGLGLVRNRHWTARPCISMLAHMLQGMLNATRMTFLMAHHMQDVQDQQVWTRTHGFASANTATIGYKCYCYAIVVRSTLYLIA